MKIKAKVFVNKANGQKLVTIPKWSNVEAGDWIVVEFDV